jgi:hypothetical protein
MPEHNKGDMGGTMRLGRRRTLFKTEKSILSKLNYKKLNLNVEFIKLKKKTNKKENYIIIKITSTNDTDIGMKSIQSIHPI